MIRKTFAIGLAAAGLMAGGVSAPADADTLLEETVGFTGAVLFLETKVPGLIIGAVRDGEHFVEGFGLTREGGNQPDGDTVMRIGSVSKVFTTQLMADLVRDGTIGLTDPVSRHLSWDIDVPMRGGNAIRLIDLATHSSGLPREGDAPPGPPEQPEKNRTAEAFARNLAADPLIFTPGKGVHYSNFGYDVLGFALADAAGEPFDALMQKRILDPLGMKDTAYTPRPDQDSNRMQGHGFDGEPLPDTISSPGTYASGALYSTANDMLRWFDWHLDRFAEEGAETRAIHHAAYLFRDGLNPVFGMDESGHMDVMGLGWVVMHPEGDRPLLLQKAGGAQGIFCYAAIAPMHGVGVFVAINEYDFGAALAMAGAVNDLIATLAPR